MTKKNKEETTEELIKRMEDERDQLLKERPDLQPLQDKIDETLRKAGDSVHNRNAALQSLMLNTWFEIVPVCNEAGYTKKYNAKKDREILKNKIRVLH